MRWAAHIAVGAGLAAAVNPLTIPAAVIGATAPDWLEWLFKAFGQPVRHRTVTHVLGSSPLARGTVCFFQQRAKLARFIPAGAGNRVREDQARRSGTVHPRWRGEQTE